MTIASPSSSSLYSDYISCSTSIHCASEGELGITVSWIGFIDHVTIGMSAVKDDLLPFSEIDGTSDLFRTDFREDVASLNSPRQFIKRIVGAYVGMEWIAEMIDVLLHFFGNLAPRKAFKRL